MRLFRVFVIGLVFLIAALWTAAEAKDILIGFSGPLSGPAAEYGQDCANGIDLAIRDINVSGGVTVKGERYTFKLEKMDDRVDPATAVANSKRFKANGAVAVFNPVTQCAVGMMKINQEKGNEFLVLAYTSLPAIADMGNRLTIILSSPFTLYAQAYADMAWEKGARKAAMLVTANPYGDGWRKAFRAFWEAKGGKITADKSADYYKELNFTEHLKAVLATSPDIILVGGPTPTTALLVDQARKLGYSKGFLFIDQVKMDVIAHMMKSTKLIEGSIGTGLPTSLSSPAVVSFEKKYKETYRRAGNWESIIHYTAMQALARAIAASGSAENIQAIRGGYAKAFPMLGDKSPVELYGISPKGVVYMHGATQEVKDGKFVNPLQWVWWTHSQSDVAQITKLSRVNVTRKIVK